MVVERGGEMEAVEADVHHKPGSSRTALSLVEKLDGVLGGDDRLSTARRSAGDDEWILAVRTGDKRRQGGVDGSSRSTAHPLWF